MTFDNQSGFSTEPPKIVAEWATEWAEDEYESARRLKGRKQLPSTQRGKNKHS